MQLTPDQLAALRRDYSLQPLNRADLNPDPLEQFNRWLHQAHEAEILEPNGMTLSTVDADGQPHLLDFGIAKLLESDLTEVTALTQLAGRALTPEYASPEQIRGEPLGTASDVYSLGVIAYELLAEAKPYRLKRGSAAEMEEAIAHADPTLASAATPRLEWRKALRGDLDAILNRALKKRVDERYPSVDAFAQDLQRAMAGRPVHARPDSRAYRANKFVRRNGLAVGLGSAMALTVVAGGAVSTWQAVAAHRAALRAESEANRQIAVRDLYSEAMMALSVTATDHPEAFAKPHVVTQALQDKLREMAPRYAEQPFERAAQLDSVMLQLNYDNEFEASLAVGREYLALLKANQGPTADILAAYSLMGRNLFKLKRYDECEAVRREGLAWQGDVQDDGITLTWRVQIGTDLGNFLVFRGKRIEARKVLEQAQALAHQEKRTSAGRYQIGFFLGSYWTAFDEARQMQAAQAAHDGTELDKTLDADQHGNFLKYYGIALLDNGRAAEAERALQSSREFYTKAYGISSLNATDAAGRVAMAIARQGDYERANRVLAEQRRMLAAAHGGFDPSLAARLLERQLEIDWLAGDVDAMRAHLPADDALTGPPGGVRANIGLLRGEARALALMGRGAQAVQVMTFLRTNWPDPGLATAECLGIQTSLASAQLAAGQPEAARATARGVLALLEHEQATAGRAFVTANELDALASARLGDTREAALAIAAADRVQPAPPFTSDVARADSLLHRAETLRAIGRATDAAQAARDALALLKNQRPDSPRLVQARAS